MAQNNNILPDLESLRGPVFRDYMQPVPPPPQAAPFNNPVPMHMQGPYSTGMTTGAPPINNSQMELMQKLDAIISLLNAILYTLQQK